jgi:hypothetical protein
VNRIIGSIVVCCAVAVGLGSITGCPGKKDTKTTGAGGGGGTGTGGGTTPGFTIEEKVLVVGIDKETGEVDVAIVRVEFKEKEVKLTFKDAPDFAKFEAEPTKGDKATIKVKLDKAKAKEGKWDVKVHGDGEGGKSADATLKFEVSKAGAVPAAGSFKFTAPDKAEAKIADKKGSFELKVKRDMLDGEIKVSFKNEPKGVTFKADSIAAKKDTTMVEFTFDDTAKAGDYDVMVHGMSGEAKADHTIKLTLK